MLTSKDLRKQHLEASLTLAKPRKAAAISLSKKIGIQYNVQLQKLVSAVKKSIEEKIIPVLFRLEREYVADGWDDDIDTAFESSRHDWSGSSFEYRAERVASEFVGTSNKVNQEKFEQSMRQIGIDVYGESPKLREYLAAATSENARLIKSIPAQYLDRVETLVKANMRAGRRPGAIVEQIRTQFGVTQARARMIARDQTAKVNSELSERRQREVGFEHFQWVTSQDERVRHDHAELARKDTKFGTGIYRWDDPPKNSRGEVITPGSDYSCRCTARPIPKRQLKQQ